jgi:hypothetical protein
LFVRRHRRLVCIDGGEGSLIRWPSLQEQPDSAFEYATRQENAPTAPVALEANIGSESHHSPVHAPAWVRLAEPHLVFQEEIDRGVAVDRHFRLR